MAGKENKQGGAKRPRTTKTKRALRRKSGQKVEGKGFSEFSGQLRSDARRIRFKNYVHVSRRRNGVRERERERETLKTNHGAAGKSHEGETR